jgi:hypothetical protein
MSGETDVSGIKAPSCKAARCLRTSSSDKEHSKSALAEGLLQLLATESAKIQVRSSTRQGREAAHRCNGLPSPIQCPFTGANTHFRKRSQLSEAGRQTCRCSRQLPMCFGRIAT